MPRTRARLAVLTTALLAGMLLPGCPSSTPPDGDGDGHGPTTFTLTVRAIGNGAVESEPDAIDCPGVCVASFDEGTSIELFAKPHQASTFDGWTGNADCSDGQVTMTTDLACIATFRARNGFTTISSGGYHSLALDHHGNAWGWGWNKYGQVGDATSANDRLVPTAVEMPDGIVFATISAGVHHSLALDRHGDVWGWGYAAGGQLGNDSLAPSIPDPTPGYMPDSIAFTAISAGGYHSLALDQHGNAWGWGSNQYGQVGDTTYDTTRRVITASRMPEGTSFTEISAGGYHSLALDEHGAAWGWGNDGSGQVGNDSTPNPILGAPTRVRMPVDVTFASISAGTNHSLALDQDGHAWGWGNNEYGQVGDATYANERFVPTAVRMPDGVSFTKISAGMLHSLALDQHGNAWGWGNDSGGQVGNDSTPNPILGAPTRVQTPEGIDFTEISAGDFHSLGVDENADIWSWGMGDDGQLGDGTTHFRYVPVKVPEPIP